MSNETIVLCNQNTHPVTFTNNGKRVTLASPKRDVRVNKPCLDDTLTTCRLKKDKKNTKK